MSTYLKKNAGKARALRQFLIVFAAFCVAVCLFIAGSSRMNSGQVQASSNHEIIYKSIRVNAGDTLWEIADIYMGTAYDNKNDYIDEVKEINHMAGTELQAGSYIIVPCVSVME